MKIKLRSVIAAMIVAAAGAVMTAAGIETAAAHGPNGASDRTGPGMMGQMGARLEVGPHLTLTRLRTPAPAELKRARDLLDVMRRTLADFRDPDTATRTGYLPYLPSVPQEVFHFTSRSRTAAEYLGDFDPARPGALLYVRRPFGGYRLVGAMYSAPPTATPPQLDQLIPLSVGRWHAHTNICLPRGVTAGDMINGRIAGRPDIRSPVTQAVPFGVPTAGRWNRGTGLRMRLGFLADGRFGPGGSVSTPDECRALGGTFYPQMFGWMIHVYPFSGDDLKVAFGTEVP